MELPPTVILGAAGVIGAGLKGLWDRFWHNKDKKRERDSDLAEGQRNELRHAYADLVAAYSKQPEAAMELLTNQQIVDEMTQAVEQAKQGQQEQAAQALKTRLIELLERSVQDAKVYSALITETQMKGVVVILLEDASEFRERVKVLHSRPVRPPVSLADHVRFLADLDAQRDLVGRLIAALQGRFAPTTWHTHKRSPKDTNQQLPQSETKPLPPKDVKSLPSSQPSEPEETKVDPHGAGS